MPSPHPTRRGVLAAGALAMSAPFVGLRHAQAATELKLGYPLPQNSQFGAAATAFAETLSRQTGGRFSVRQFPASALGGERNMIEAVQLGTQDLALVSTGALGGFVPETGLFDLPFLFRDAAHAHATLDGDVGRTLLARFPARNLVALAWGEGGFRQITNNRRPIRTPDDIRGLKIRTQENPIHMAAFRGMGANPTPIAWPETYSALQQNAVDGQDNPISVIEASKLFQVQKHLSLTRHLYSPAVFLAAPPLLAGLNDADRQAFADAARAGADAMRRRVAADDQSGVQTLRQAGMAVVSDVDRAAFEQVLAPSYQDFARQFGATAIERIRAVR